LTSLGLGAPVGEGVVVSDDDDDDDDDDDADDDADGDDEGANGVKAAVSAGSFASLRELHVAGCRALPPLVAGDGGALGANGARRLVILYAAMCGTSGHVDADADEDDETGGVAGNGSSANAIAVNGVITEASGWWHVLSHILITHHRHSSHAYHT
jgi:hypothetical protein